jgi:glucose-6-phosphate isomerase
MERTLSTIGDGLTETLTIVISKSGGTKETRNGMLEAQAAYHEMGLHFGHHAVAVTEPGSQLDKVADSERWIARSQCSTGWAGAPPKRPRSACCPQRSEGFDIDAMLAGAAEMDEATREKNTLKNPAALLAGGWYHARTDRAPKTW